MPHKLRSPLLRQHPRALLPRRIMANMLIMPTGQLSHPMQFIVLMKAANGLCDTSLSIHLTDSSSKRQIVSSNDWLRVHKSGMINNQFY
jgi:hypothetical protein